MEEHMEKRKSIAEIKEILELTEITKLPKAAEAFSDDERIGVQKLLKSCQKKYELYKKEAERLENMLFFERKYANFHAICGIDEAGRGPLAGPVVAAAVILPKETKIWYLNDSKQLSYKLREELYEEIMEKAVSVGVGVVGPERIDEINILQADYEAMRIAVNKLNQVPDILLNDAVRIPGMPMKQVPIVKGDAKSLSIAAASVVAKVNRDRIMEEYEKLYPKYEFASHKGYGSKAHIEAIQKYGLCPIHRKTFVKNIEKGEEDENG